MVKLIITSISSLAKILSTLNTLTLYFSALFLAASILISAQATTLKLLNRF